MCPKLDVTIGEEFADAVRSDTFPEWVESLAEGWHTMDDLDRMIFLAQINPSQYGDETKALGIIKLAQTTLSQLAERFLSRCEYCEVVPAEGFVSGDGYKVCRGCFEACG